MSVGRMGVRAVVVAAGVLVSVLLMAAPSWATGGTKLCIPTTENAPVKTPLKNGTCANTKTEKYTLTELGAEGKEGKQGLEGKEGKQGLEGKEGKEGKEGPQGLEGKEGKEGKEGPEGKNALSSDEISTLKGILPCITKVDEGIDKKPTVQFHGCNVQIVNGEGKTKTTNGEGNLVIGYDEFPGGQTGSHNLIFGFEQTFTSYGSIIGGSINSDTGPFSVAFGQGNTASGEDSAVSGGLSGAASGRFSAVSGGASNTASGEDSAVSGGVVVVVVVGVVAAVAVGGVGVGLGLGLNGLACEGGGGCCEGGLGLASATGLGMGTALSTAPPPTSLPLSAAAASYASAVANST